MAESKDAPKGSRKVKNPETFRERAIKASEQGQQPDKRSRLRSVAARPVRPVGKIANRIGQNKAVRIVRKPFHWLGLILIPRYVRNSFIELKQVQWPNRSESRRLTFAVLIFSLVFGVFVAVIDYGLDKLFREVLLK